jgi:hypothetical protein
MSQQNLANPRLINSYLPNMLKSKHIGNTTADFENLNNVSGIQTEFNLDMVRQDRRDSLYESVLMPETENLMPEKRRKSKSPVREGEDEELYKSMVTV